MINIELLAHGVTKLSGVEVTQSVAGEVANVATSPMNVLQYSVAMGGRNQVEVV